MSDARRAFLSQCHVEAEIDRRSGRRTGRWMIIHPPTRDTISGGLVYGPDETYPGSGEPSLAGTRICGRRIWPCKREAVAALETLQRGVGTR